MDTWQTILLAFGGNAALLAVLGWLAKSFVEHQLKKDASSFQSGLEAKSKEAITRLENELQLRTLEHEIRFSRLHEKRALVISELYGHFVEVLWEAESLLSPVEWAGDPKKNEKYVIADKKLVEFFRFFDKNRIYLPEELCRSLEETGRQVRNYVIQFGVHTMFDDQHMSDHVREQKYEAMNKGYTAIKEDIPKARRILEEEFRTLLGASPLEPQEHDA